MTKLAAIDGKILLTRSRERVCRGQEDRLPPAGQAPPRSLDVRAILNIGLQHRSFTSLSPNGPSSEKASDADFDCAWGEKMRIGTEEVGPSQECRLGHGLRRVSLWADESGVSLQYAVREAVAVGGSDRHFPRDSWMPKARSNESLCGVLLSP